MRRFAVVTLFVSLVASSLAVDARQAPPPIPAKPGVAAGTVKVGTTTVKLTHAYVGAVDDGDFQVVLTDGEVPADLVATEVRRGSGQRLLRQGKVSGISMLVSPKGFLLNLIPFVADLRGNRMLGSAGSLAAFTVTKAGVTGQGSKGPEDTDSAKWSYSASWNAVPVTVK